MHVVDHGSFFSLVNEATSLPSLTYLFCTLLVLALILGPLEYFFPAQKQKGIFHQGLKLDVVYWFFTPFFTKLATNYVLALVLFGLFSLQGLALDSSFLEGFGPLSRQPLPLQAIEIILLADFIDYWTHRTFHLSRFWRIHAIHHSPEELNWISSSRMHPLNDLVTRMCQVIPIAMLGFSGNAVVSVVPFLFFYVIFIHSNLSWDFGRFRYVLVSPAYHRWHHTSDEEGIDKNFASIFPIWDILFGTCHFPKRLPKKYGVVKEVIPETLAGQLLFPFRQANQEKEPQGR